MAGALYRKDHKFSFGESLQKPCLNIFLFSKTGNGKSSLANSLTDTKEFPVSENNMVSETKACHCVSRNENELLLTVVDTPGTMDTNHPEDAVLEICRAMTLCPDGFDACLLVLRLDVRFTEEEQMAAKMLSKIFGSEIFKYCIVVFSFGDTMDNDEIKFKEALAQTRKSYKFMDELLTDCDNRVLLVDNGKKCDKNLQKQQIQKIINMVSAMAQRQQSRFTNKYFILAKKYIMELHEKEKQNDKEKIAEKILQEVKTDGNTCFPADGVVQTPNGAMRMDELSVGQSVLCMHNNKLTYSTVYMWGHRDHTSWSNSFVTLTTDTAQLTLTSDHLMLIIDEMGDEVSVAAGDVCAGQTVQVLHHVMSDAACLKHEKVVAVEKCVMRRGLFAPFTMDGNLVVNGVLASCYINCLPHAVSHGLLWPVRFSWRLVPSVVDAFNELGDDGMPSWVSLVSKRILPTLSWLEMRASNVTECIVVGKSLVV